MERLNNVSNCVSSKLATTKQLIAAGILTDAEAHGGYMSPERQIAVSAAIKAFNTPSTSSSNLKGLPFADIPQEFPSEFGIAVILYDHYPKKSAGVTSAFSPSAITEPLEPVATQSLQNPALGDPTTAWIASVIITHDDMTITRDWYFCQADVTAYPHQGPNEDTQFPVFNARNGGYQYQWQAEKAAFLAGFTHVVSYQVQADGKGKAKRRVVKKSLRDAADMTQALDYVN